MGCDKKYKKWIWLSLYDELEAREQDDLQKHIDSCDECRRERELARQFCEQLSGKEVIRVSDELLRQSRDALFHRVRMAARYGARREWLERLRHIVVLDFRPQWQMAIALGLLGVGILLGAKFFRHPARLNPALLEQIARQGEAVQQIENVSFDQRKNQVVVRYQTVQRHSLQGNPNDPQIQRLLIQTLISDSRPNLRLRSVNALQDTKSFDQRVLDALIEVLENDDNSGVRLKAIKILNSIPWSESVQVALTRVFIKVLLQEKNSAVRIQAIDGLERIRHKDAVSVLHKAAEKDSNDYVRNKAAVLLERIKNPEISESNNQ
ncbi:MAG: hypothetical protein GXO74_13550 [Calditrichaeota bacterium]|nr:hypothetical protein [Calditrichota bacterium]